jgi:hypothetical protein
VIYKNKRLREEIRGGKMFESIEYDEQNQWWVIRYPNGMRVFITRELIEDSLRLPYSTYKEIHNNEYSWYGLTTA